MSDIAPLVKICSLSKLLLINDFLPLCFMLTYNSSALTLRGVREEIGIKDNRKKIVHFPKELDQETNEIHVYTRTKKPADAYAMCAGQKRGSSDQP